MCGMELRAQERRLVEIRRRATLLAVALVSEPFSAETDERLRAYLTDDARDAQSLARELCELPEEVLRSRIRELVSEPAAGGVVGEGVSEAGVADAVRAVAKATGRPVWVMDVHGRRADVARRDLRGLDGAE